MKSHQNNSLIILSMFFQKIMTTNILGSLDFLYYVSIGIFKTLFVKWFAKLHVVKIHSKYIWSHLTFLFVSDKAIAITSWIESMLVTFIFMVHIRWTLVKLQFLCHVFFWMSWSTNESVHIPTLYAVFECNHILIYLYMMSWYHSKVKWNPLHV